MAYSGPKNQIALIKAFDGIKTTYPAAWELLSTGLRDMLEFEAKYVIRARPDMLQLSQGRAQIADDIMGLMHKCTDLAEQIRMASPTLLPTDQPPKFK